MPTEVFHREQGQCWRAGLGCCRHSGTTRADEPSYTYGPWWSDYCVVCFVGGWPVLGRMSLTHLHCEGDPDNEGYDDRGC